MNRTLLSYAKMVANSAIIEFGAQPGYFNGTRCESIDRASIRKQLIDSIEIELAQSGNIRPIQEFKLTNQSITTWDDYWLDKEGDFIVDPLIVRVNLQRNKLVYVNMNTPRSELTDLNLEGNTELQHLYIHEAPKLERLDLSGCTGLQYVSLGINRSIKELIVKDCGMSTETLQQLLRDFTPTMTANANLRGIGAFRKTHNTLLDLRGNQIDWNNRKIASKIRLLLTNNWVVKWDNNPPTEIIPIQMYGFFVESRIGRN